MEQQIERRTMSAADVATYLGLHKDTVYELVKAKEIPHLKIGHRIFFLQEVIERWLEERMGE